MSMKRPRSKSTIKSQLIISFLLVISIFLSVYTFAFILLKRTYGEIIEFQINQNDLNNLSIIMDSGATEIDNFLISGNQTYFKNSETIFANFQSELKSLKNKLPTIFLYQLKDIANMEETYKEFTTIAISDLQKGIDRIYINRKRQELYRLNGYIKAECGNLLSLYLNHTKEKIIILRKTLEIYENLAYFAILLSGFIAAYIALRIANGIAEPLHQLSERALLVSAGNLDVSPLEYSKNDELGNLVHSFNTMTLELRNLIQDVKDKAILEIKLKEEKIKITEIQNSLQKTELELLQSRINPHFLFNALSAVTSLARSESAPNTREAVESIAQIMRYTISSKKQPNKLEEEIELVKNYLYLQGLRFGKRLRWSVDLDEDSSDILIPPFSIQPFVENAVIHGIEPKETGGTVQVYCTPSLSKDAVEIVIRDDGVGIEENILTKIMSTYQNDKSNHLGIANVRKRLEMLYGENTVKIESIVNKGTSIKITIPYRSSSGNFLESHQ